MIKLQCECCGGVLKKIGRNIYKCNSCNMEYLHEDSMDIPIRIERYESPVRTIKARFECSDVVIKEIGYDKMSEIAIKKLTDELSKALAPMIEIEHTFDPYLYSHIVTGRVKIVEP